MSGILDARFSGYYWFGSCEFFYMDMLSCAPDRDIVLKQ